MISIDRLVRLPRPFRLLFLLASSGLYLVLLISLQQTLGSSVAYFSLLPVGVAALLFGPQAGVLTSVLVSASIFLYRNAVIGQGWEGLFLQGGLAGIFILLASSVVLGRIGDLYRRLASELEANQKAQDALHRSQEALRLSEADERGQRLLLQTLHATSVALNRTLDLEAVLDLVLENLARVLPHDAANIMIVEGGLARMVRSRGYDAAHPCDQALSLFSVDHVHLRKMGETGQSLIVPDTRADPDWITLPEMEWIRAYAGAPIQVKGVPVGFLNLDSARVGCYTSEHAGRLLAFADQVAVAIENARLFDDVQRYARQSVLLNDITRTAISAPDMTNMLLRLADRLGELFQADGAVLLLLDSDRKTVLPGGVYGSALQRFSTKCLSAEDLSPFSTLLTGLHRVRAIEDIHNHPDIDPTIPARYPGFESALILPLADNGEPLGCALVTFSKPRVFSPDDIALGEQAAGQIALGLARFRLLEAERRRTGQLQRANRLISALSHVAARIETAHDSDRVLEALGSELEHLNVNCLVALQPAGLGEMKIRYLSLKEPDDLDPSRPPVRWRDFTLSTDRFPFYEQVIQQKRVCFSDDSAIILDRVLQGFSPVFIERLNRLAGVTPGIRVFFLPLAAEERVFGSLWVWGEELEEADGKAFSIFASQVSVALENSRLYSEVQTIAITDELTGIYNRRGLLELGRREAERAARFARPLSALLLDIDDFKVVNDTHGHFSGDQVIQGLVERVRREVREIDLFGRYGGDEFLLLLPEADAATASRVAERLRRAVGAAPFMTERGEIAVTISIGAAGLPQGLKLADLIAGADAALYQAKDGGRNCVSVNP